MSGILYRKWNNILVLQWTKPLKSSSQSFTPQTSDKFICTGPNLRYIQTSESSETLIPALHWAIFSQPQIWTSIFQSQSSTGQNSWNSPPLKSEPPQSNFWNFHLKTTDRLNQNSRHLHLRLCYLHPSRTLDQRCETFNKVMSVHHYNKTLETCSPTLNQRNSWDIQARPKPSNLYSSHWKN